MHKGKLMQTGVIDTYDKHALVELLDSLPFVVYCEDVHLTFSKLNAKVLLNHAKNIGGIAAMCFLKGIRYELVPATVWQAHAKIYKGKKQKGKEGSILCAQQLGYAGKNHNIADAVLIAQYGTEHRRLGL